MSDIRRRTSILILLSVFCTCQCRNVDSFLPGIVDALRPSPTPSPIASDDRFLIEAEPDELHTVHQLAQRAGFNIVRKLHSFPNIFVAERLIRRKRSANEIVQELITAKYVRWAEHVSSFVREKRNLFDYSRATGNISMGLDELRTRGYTGQGVSIAVLDDGVDHSHPALHESYSDVLSYDFTNDRPDAMPEQGTQNSHGTHCAGIMFMSPDSKCGTGVASGSKLAGLKMLNEKETVNDILEGEALAYQHENMDIYSVSWGPRDDGRSMEKPHRLATLALQNGVRKGRHGLGSLYVWASGNGGLENDDCAMDGYASNYYTMTFGVVDENGRPPWYAEGCPAVLAAVHTSSQAAGGMSTTDVGGGCAHFSGSSAAAPLAAGILALVLQVNPLLTQRDVQHLVVRTSSFEQLDRTNSEQTVNGAGLQVSRYTGFGLINAPQLVSAASKWTNVGPENTCSREVSLINGTFSSLVPLSVDIPFAACSNTSAEVNFVERVELIVSLSHPSRGRVSISSTSPSGSVTEMLRNRRNDFSADGIQQWSFVSVQNWGERPAGSWKVEVSSKGEGAMDGALESLKLVVHGTRDDPMIKNQHIAKTKD